MGWAPVFGQTWGIDMTLYHRKSFVNVLTHNGIEKFSEIEINEDNHKTESKPTRRNFKTHKTEIRQIEFC